MNVCNVHNGYRFGYSYQNQKIILTVIFLIVQIVVVSCHAFVCEMNAYISLYRLNGRCLSQYAFEAYPQRRGAINLFYNVGSIVLFGHFNQSTNGILHTC